jgi:hypothetical protein
VLPLVGAAGILVAITLDVDPIHDIDLFVFEGAWVWATADACVAFRSAFVAGSGPAATP